MSHPIEIESTLNEERVFTPPADFSADADIQSFKEYERIYAEAKNDPEGFWAKQAEDLDWFKKWDTVLDWNAPFAKWFVGGKLNVAYNCLDRHLRRGGKNKAAIIWEGEPGEHRARSPTRNCTARSRKFANVLKELGVKTGDVVAIYMPMVPELPIAMLACARIGATHTVIFGGFSRRGAPRPHQRRPRQGARHRRRRLPPRQRGPAQGQRRRGRGGLPDRRERRRLPTHRRRQVRWKHGRDHWWHELMQGRRRELPGRSRSTPSIRSTSSTPPARPGSPRASCTRPAAI